MNLRDIPKSTIGLLTNLPHEHAGKLIKMALSAMQPKKHQDLSKHLERLSIGKNIPKEQLYESLAAYIAIIKLFIHSTDKDFISTLVEIGFPTDFAKNLPFVNNRKELEDTFFVPYYNYFQNVASIKWRIDISLLNSSLKSKTFPNVILCIKMKNGKDFVIELNSKAFHLLRFNVALILKEMKSLRSSSAITKMIK